MRHVPEEPVNFPANVEEGLRRRTFALHARSALASRTCQGLQSRGRQFAQSAIAPCSEGETALRGFVLDRGGGIRLTSGGFTFAIGPGGFCFSPIVVTAWPG